MPADFSCDGCELHFSVGWYHYHNFEGGYGSSTLVVCTRCGAQHSVEHALDYSRRGNVESFFDLTLTEIPASARAAVASKVRKMRGLDLAGALQTVRTLPVLIAQALPEDEMNELRSSFVKLGATVTFSETKRELAPRAQQHDRFFLGVRGPDSKLAWQRLDVNGAVTGPTASFELEQQRCGNCHELGALVAAWPDGGSICPRCSAPLRATGGWIT